MSVKHSNQNYDKMKKSTAKYLLGTIAILQLLHIYLVNLISSWWNPLYFIVAVITALLCIYFYIKVDKYENSDILDDFD